MKMKRIFAFCAAAVLTLAMTTSVFANTVDYGWDETYSGGKKIASTFKSSDISSKLADVQPGDTFTLTANIKSTADFDTNWYLDNNVVRDLEEDGGKDGAYTYKLTYKPADGEEVAIVDSASIGGDNGSGLSDATADDVLDMIYLDTLASKGGTGTVTLTIEFEGETIDNAYQEALASLEIAFHTEDATKIQEEIKTGEKVVVTKVTKVKTGDNNQMLIFSIIGICAGIALFVMWILAGKRNKKEEVQ